MRISHFMVPITVASISGLLFWTINSSAVEVPKAQQLDNRPTVTAVPLAPQMHTVKISAFGELTPYESTHLSAQVNGQVTRWHASFTQGGFVKRGELLFSLDSSDYQAKVTHAKAALQQAQADLIEEQALADVARSEAERFPEEQRTALFLRTPQLLSAQAAVDSARASLRQAQKELEYCNIYAPFDALVTARMIGTGQYVTAGESVALIHNVEKAEIITPIAGFEAKFLPDTRQNIAVTISTNDQTVVRSGTIMPHLAQFDSKTRMRKLYVTLEDPYGLRNQQDALAFGQYVQVTFDGKALSQIYSIPQKLVKNNKVWTVDHSHTLRQQDIEIVHSDGSNYLVQGRFHDTDLLLHSLPEHPVDGQPVKLVADQPVFTGLADNHITPVRTVYE
ncbi:efflux RND transporter periplasmic adaptor subunit [Pseudoalteromonas rubra]|uniref:Efflux RND transporter periplasmic adaptor subunit n=1 Tax=Pseudoalteromonas rubra TaxID=43658 RepID=A0A4Q7DXV6_9GAMM|nr:efflux RND transporter periplasmic adaptor subunit [Pseudoalteromonas rubra]RZM69549.1 efflux RND transporter periplasmic adaptor subunit [Pseudoalteromonas rubra]